MGLGLRLAAVFATLVALTAIGIGGASYVTTGRQFAGEIDDFLEARSAQIADGDRSRPDGRGDKRRGDDDDDDDVLVVAVENDAEVQVLERDGDIMSNSGLLLPVTSVDLELADRDGRAVIRTVTINDVEHRMITRHIDGGGAVQVARSLEASSLLLGALRTRLLLVAGGFSAVAALIGWIFAQRVTEPLRDLTDSVDEIAATGDLTVPIPTEAPDEVGRLAGGFERMLGALDLSREQQKRLVQDAAHELRTPLTSAMANVSLLARHADIEEGERSAMLEGVHRELRELNSIIGEIVELATDTHEAPETGPVDLADVVGEAVERFSARSPRPVEVDVRSVVVEGDPPSLVRAVTNLLSNADKYSPAGEPVSVKVAADGWVTVSDRGEGIPPDERDLVFDRFYRRVEDRSRPGSGLGLAIVARVAEVHSGEVRVDDAPGGGALVGFRVPPA